MDFTLPPEIDPLRLKVRGFIAEEVLPLEDDPESWNEFENVKLDVRDRVRARAKAAGLWAPQMPASSASIARRPTTAICGCSSPREARISGSGAE